MSDKSLNGQVAIVTGASRGIGAAIAKRFAAEGAAVAIAARSAKDLGQVAREIAQAGGKTLPVATDVAREADVRRLVSLTKERFGRLDILVNSAGIGIFCPLADTPTEQWDRVMAVNARGPFMLCREAVPLMAESGGGCIINIGSVVSVKGYVNQGAYSASKHALLGLTKVLAQEVQDEGIRVHIICPGGVDTNLVTQARPDLDRSMLMTAREIADIAMFLVVQRGNAIIDQINVRRLVSKPWFSE